MKKVKWIFLLLIPHLLWGQKTEYEYVPFQEGGIWSVNNMKYMTNGDTVINGKSYMKVYQHEEWTPFEFDITRASYFCAIRNDVDNKKVYGIYYKATEVYNDGDYYSSIPPLYMSTDTSEFLLYDFSLQIGDTVTVASFEPYIDKICLLIAQRDSIMNIWYYLDYQYISSNFYDRDSLKTLLNGDVHRRIIVNFSHNDRHTIGNQMWIEGIGSSSGFFTHADYPESTGDIPPRNLICFQQSGDILYRTPIVVYDQDQDCYSKGLSVSIDDHDKHSSLHIYPNPSYGIFYLDMNDLPKNLPCDGVIYNSLGQIMQQFTVHDRITEIDLNPATKGIYFVKLQYKNNTVETRKIIMK